MTTGILLFIIITSFASIMLTGYTTREKGHYVGDAIVAALMWGYTLFLVSDHPHGDVLLPVVLIGGPISFLYAFRKI